jgi:RNA polymerase sigma-70 factor (ECF subfamily)
MSENELLELSIQGDEAAFTQLVEETVNKVRPAIFNAYNPLNPEDFKDALQVASVKAWGKMAAFRKESQFATWFFIILKNEVLNILKTKNNIRKHEMPIEELSYNKDSDSKSNVEDDYRNPRLMDRAVVETAQTILEKQDELIEYRKMLTSVLDKLNPIHSEVIKLVFEEGKSYEEVSMSLNLPIGTVMSRIYHARKHATKLIQQYALRHDIELSCVGGR